jgi:hypothetical protein
MLLEPLTEQQFSEYYKFIFVRNPWDRMVSNYKYFTKPSHAHLGFNENFGTFIQETINTLSNKTDIGLDDIHQRLYWHTYPQSPHAETDNKELFVDFIGKFENIDADWEYVCNHIGIDKKLPHSNATEHKPYQEYYTDETKEIIADLYSRDIELFKYKF